MSIENTLSIIKPDITNRNLLGSIYKRFEDAGLKIVAAKMIHMTEADVRFFYSEHTEKKHFQELLEFMISAPVFVQVLRAENAIIKYRQIMGNTDPSKAEPGTIRADYSESIGRNSVHGSDSKESANREINFFFAGMNIHNG